MELELDARAFRHWREGRGWTIEPGEYQLNVGRSSQDLPLQATVHVPARG